MMASPTKYIPNSKSKSQSAVSFLDVPNPVKAGFAAKDEIQNPYLENPGPRLSLHIAMLPVGCHIDHFHAS